MNIHHQLGEAGDSTDIFSNFTDSPLVEDSWECRENIYRSVVETQTELICRFLPHGILTFANLACCHYFGKSRQEMIGKNFFSFFSETDRESAMRNILSLDGHYPLKTYEYRAITGNGEIRWQQWIVQPLFDEKKQLVEFQSVGRDITDLKQTQEVLRQRKERLEGILQSLDDVVWSVDASTGETLYVSPAIEEVYGRRGAEFLHNSHLWREVIHPKDRQQLESQEAILFATGVLDLEYRIICPNGEMRWLHNRMRLIRDQGGKAIGIDGIATDITKRKQAQEELAASKELFRLLLEGVKDYAIYMLDRNGCIVSWNAGAQRIYGFKTEEIIGQHFSCFFSSEDVRSLQPVKELQLALDQGRCEIESWRVRSDGSRFWANVAISTLHDDLGNLRGFAKVTRDITDRKLAEELLRHRLEMENLVSSISSSFINLKSPSINAGINRALQGLGEFAKVDRAYLFLLKDNDTKLENTHLWSAAGVEPKLDRLSEITVNSLPWEMACLKNLETLYVPTVEDLPSAAAKEKEFWLTAGIRSLLYIPLIYSEKFVGFLGFDTLTEIKAWRDEDIKLLKLVGEIFVNLLERHQAENSLIESQKKYQTLFQVLPIGISISDESGNIVEANPGSEKILSISASEHTKRAYNSPEWQIIRPNGTPMPNSEFPSVIALQENRIVENLEMGIVKGEHEITWISVTAAPIPLTGYGVAIAYIDISERKKAEEEIKRTELFLNSIVENIPDTIFVKDAKTLQFVRLNKAGETLLGYAKNDLIGKTDREIFPAESAQKSMLTDRKVLTEKALVDLTEEAIYTRHNGQRILHTKKIPILGINGEVKYLLGISEDITERKESEEILRQQKEILQTIFDRIPVMIAVFDMQGKIILVNRELESVLGWSFGELGKINLLEECYPNPKYRQEILNFMLTANGKWQDMKTRAKNGVIIDTSWANIRLSDGRTIGIGQDITERKKAEETLRKVYSDLRDREEQYRTLTTHAPVGIFQTNAQGKVNFVNQRWCEIVGISPEEAYGHSWLQALHFDRRKQTLFEDRQADNQKANTYEIRFQVPDGKLVWAIVNTAPIHDTKRMFLGIIGTILDITDRKITEKALRKSEAKFQKLAANLPGIIYQFKLSWDGAISLPYISAGCRDIYELEPEQIRQNASLIIDTIYPEDREKFEESLAISAKTLDSWLWEGRIVVNGKIKWVQGAARPERKVNGDIIWDGLLFDISDRKTAELRLAKINECFLNFSSNPTENINSLTALCGELLGSTSAFYTGLEGERLKMMGVWNRSNDNSLTEDAEIGLGYEDIEAAGNGILTVENLSNSHWFENNLKIAHQQNMKTYFGWAVKYQNNSIGALCAIYQKNFIPKEDDEKVMGIIAAAIGVEEERRRVEEALRLQTEQERLIGAIAQRIRQTLNLDHILNTTVDEVLQLLQCDRVLIFRLYPDGTGKVTTEAVKSGWPATWGETFPHECFPSECYENYCQGYPRAITDVASDLVANCLAEYLEKIGVKSKLVVPILQQEMLWGLLIVHQCEKLRYWQKWEIDLLSSLATQAGIAIQQSQLYQQLESVNEELHRLVTVDSLTQVANRRRFDEFLVQEWRRLAREQASLSLIMCDVDFFKLYNDTYGHQAGDECLKQVASAIANSIKRPADLVARYGGEEFAVILPNTDTAGATCVAEEIRKAIETLKILHCASPVGSHVTISLGVASLVPFPAFSPEMLIDAADRALYRAKEQGRDSYYVMG